jgi:hypothetical protein
MVRVVKEKCISFSTSLVTKKAGGGDSMDDTTVKAPYCRASGMRYSVLLLIALSAYPPARAATEADDLETALSLATMLRSARAVIASNQSLINDPAVGDKGLTGDVVLTKAVARYREAKGRVPVVDGEARQARLLKAQMDAIRYVMERNQGTINRLGVGFKGFVPAVFGRLVNERFADLVGQEAEVKVTAPPVLVRNRKARPDAWEAGVIESKLGTENWPKGKVFHTEAAKLGRPAFRVLVPEYYSKGCLACHGEPKGEIDVTGYPKEGGKEGELGGVISITLYR